MVDDKLNLFDHHIRDDADNVHDRNVNELSKYYFSVIKSDTSSQNYQSSFIKEIFNYLDCSSLSKIKKRMIRDYFCYVKFHKEFIVNFACDELEFLYFIWKRINHPNNLINRDKLINNLFLMVLDCYEEDVEFSLMMMGNYHRIIKKLVCTSGRIMKILSTFTYIDYDSNLGLFLSNDILKREFLNKISIYYGENTNRKYYEEVVNEIIDGYNIIYHNQLREFKKEIIDALVFEE